MPKGGKGGGGGGSSLSLSPQITALAQQQGDIAKQQAQMGGELFAQTAGLRGALLGSPGTPGTPGSTGRRIIGYRDVQTPQVTQFGGERDFGAFSRNPYAMTVQEPIYEDFPIPGTPSAPGSPGLLQAMLQPRAVRPVPPALQVPPVPPALQVPPVPSAVQIPEPVVTPQEREAIERQYQVAGQQVLTTGVRGGALEANLANLAAGRAGQVSDLQSALAREQRGVTLQQRLVERGTAEEQRQATIQQRFLERGTAEEQRQATIQQRVGERATAEEERQATLQQRLLERGTAEEERQAQLAEETRRDAVALRLTGTALEGADLGTRGFQGATASAGAAGQQFLGLEKIAADQAAAHQAMFGQFAQSAGTAAGLKGLGKGAKAAAAANPLAAIPTFGSSVIDLLPGFVI